LVTESHSLRVSAIVSALLDLGMTNILRHLRELGVIAPASSVVVYIDNVLIFNDDSPGKPFVDFRVLQPPNVQAWHQG
jgi:hypothetical protein